MLARKTPDLVILDLGLPDGSGLELLGDLGDEDGQTVPVIVYSAQEMDAALADRVEAVLTKSRTSLAEPHTHGAPADRSRRTREIG